MLRPYATTGLRGREIEDGILSQLGQRDREKHSTYHLNIRHHGRTILEIRIFGGRFRVPEAKGAHYHKATSLRYLEKHIYDQKSVEYDYVIIGDLLRQKDQSII